MYTNSMKYAQSRNILVSPNYLMKNVMTEYRNHYEMPVSVLRSQDEYYCKTYDGETK
jgi:hypothetical protein